MYCVWMIIIPTWKKHQSTPQNQEVTCINYRPVLIYIHSSHIKKCNKEISAKPYMTDINLRATGPKQGFSPKKNKENKSSLKWKTHHTLYYTGRQLCTLRVISLVLHLHWSISDKCKAQTVVSFSRILSGCFSPICSGLHHCSKLLITYASILKTFDKIYILEQNLIYEQVWNCIV